MTSEDSDSDPEPGSESDPESSSDSSKSNEESSNTPRRGQTGRNFRSPRRGQPGSNFRPQNRGRGRGRKKRNRRAGRQEPEENIDSVESFFKEFGNKREKAILAEDPTDEQVELIIGPSDSFEQAVNDLSLTTPKNAGSGAKSPDEIESLSGHLPTTTVKKLRESIIRKQEKVDHYYWRKLQNSHSTLISQKQSSAQTVDISKLERQDEMEKEARLEALEQARLFEKEKQDAAVLQSKPEPEVDSEPELETEPNVELEMEVEEDPIPEPEVVPDSEDEPEPEPMLKPPKKKSLFRRLLDFIFKRKQPTEVAERESDIEQQPKHKEEPEPEAEVVTEPEIEEEPEPEITEEVEDEPEPEPEVVEEQEPETEVEGVAEPEVVSESEAVEESEIEEEVEKPVFELERNQQPIHLGMHRELFAESSGDAISTAEKIMQDRYNLSPAMSRQILDYASLPWMIVNAMGKKNLKKFWKDVFKQSSKIADSHLESTLESLKQDASKSTTKDMCESLVSCVGTSKFNSAQMVEIWDDLNRYTPLKDQICVYFGHLFSRIRTIEGDWVNSKLIPEEFIDIAKNQIRYFKKQNSEYSQLALELLCAISITSPHELKKYNIRRQFAGSSFEDKVERWINSELPNSTYIKEDEIKLRKGETFGGLRLSKYTPDILFEHPVRIAQSSAEIRWIDAKKHFIDPAFSTDKEVESISRQLKRYIENYGRGLVVWSNSFSEEWSQTEPNVFHTSLD